jgi:hypothetical protein
MKNQNQNRNQKTRKEGGIIEAIKRRVVGNVVPYTGLIENKQSGEIDSENVTLPC